MKTIEELLKNLARPEVLEFGLVTNRLPSVNIGGKFEPVDDEAPSNERLMAMLVTMGGSRYVDSLSDKPVQWTTKLEGVGVIAVAAILRKDIVQARFTVAKREGGPPSIPQRATAPTSAATTQPAGKPPVPPPAPSSKPGAQSSRSIPAVQPTPQPSSTKSSAAMPAARPTAPTSTPMTAVKATQQLTPATIKAVTSAASTPSTTTRAAPPASTTTAAAAPAPSPPAPAVAPPPVPTAPAAVPPPPDDEWDDDDEPTLQTLSPPVAPPHMLPPEARAKPARRPDPAAEKAAAEKAAAEKAAAEKAAAEKATAEKAAAEKAAAEKAATEKAATEKAAREKAAAEKAAAEKAAAEKAAAEKAATEKAAAEKAEQERLARERTEQERLTRERTEQERLARERAERTEQERLARERAERTEQERLARERAERAEHERLAATEAVAKAAAEKVAAAARPGPRRINTPTSIDQVDVEITTTQAGSAKNVVDHDADGTEDTVSLPGGVDVARASQQAEAQAKARGPVPTTTAPNIPEKDRPRVESSAAIDSFLAMAVSAKATDLIIVAGRPVLLRVATDLLPRTQSVSSEQVERITKEIVPARLRETLEKEGSCDFAVEHLTHGRFRVNVSRQRTGVKLTLRVVAKELPTLASLGLPDAAASGLRYQSGLVVIAGPAGHGKSSTLAALIDQINRETAKHVATIEEPIEHVHPRKKGLVSQRDVGLHTRNKAKAFHSALRSDPDVVVISELRDVDAVRMALSTAEGGRLVLATINAPSASAAMERMLRLFDKSDEHWARTTLATTLRLVIGQELVPSADRTRLHAAVELIPASTALWSAIRAGRVPEAAALKEKSRGVLLRDESLAELVRAQKVTVEVAKHYAEAPADFEALVAQRK